MQYSRLDPARKRSLSGRNLGGFTAGALVVALLCSPSDPRTGTIFTGVAEAQSLATGTKAPRFDLIGTFDVEIDGEKSPESRIYFGPQGRGVVLRSPELSSIVRILPSGQRLEAYNKADLDEAADGSVDFISGAPVTWTGRYSVAGGGPAFEIEDHRVRLISRPPLLGPASRKKVIDHNPSYAQKAARAIVQPAYVDALKKFDKPVHIKVYYGTWCSVCSEMLPNILRLEEELQGSNITFEYYGIPQNRESDPEVKRAGFNRIPAGIIYVDGQETGRLEAYRWRAPALSLMNTLRGVEVKVGDG